MQHLKCQMWTNKQSFLQDWFRSLIDLCPNNNLPTMCLEHVCSKSKRSSHFIINQNKHYKPKDTLFGQISTKRPPCNQWRCCICNGQLVSKTHTHTRTEGGGKENGWVPKSNTLWHWTLRMCLSLSLSSCVQKFCGLPTVVANGKYWSKFVHTHTRTLLWWCFPLCS